ncbi:MAG: hypothetical protein PHE17_07365 [Thiothrix sp.]|uniref:hypothetical protein n=1 Tax=Thiothrix sp. TaxID=1032 RepID=UPI00261496FE|nr:hypothetical protein [Thiothrix sp.]MDD5392823.1 hypothetical protein [Thiothrix sp.]
MWMEVKRRYCWFVIGQFLWVIASALKQPYKVRDVCIMLFGHTSVADRLADRAMLRAGVSSAEVYADAVADDRPPVARPAVLDAMFSASFRNGRR